MSESTPSIEEHMKLVDAYGYMVRHSTIDKQMEMFAAVRESARALASINAAEPCCGEFATCGRACTPRGEWIAQRRLVDTAKCHEQQAEPAVEGTDQRAPDDELKGWVSGREWETTQGRIRDLNKWRRSVREACIARGVAYDADDASATVARLASSAEPTKPHWQRTCQEGGELCAAGQRDGVVCPEESCDIDDGLRGLASSLPAPAEGWQVVPKEPTPEMICAAAETPGIKAIDDASRFHQLRGYPLNEAAFKDGSALEQAYRAMIAASPEAPK